jgi:integrase/recombinase XerD
VRSVKSCVTGRQKPRGSTRRWTFARCGAWHSHGREGPNERSADRSAGIHGASPGSHKLRKHEARLREFIAFLEAKHIDYITAKLAIGWASKSSNGHRYSGFERLSFIRSFATHLSAMDPRTEIPPAGSIRRPPTDLRPYIYTPEEIGRLMAAARKLPSPRKLRCHTYYHLIGLLATTGMRSGEAVRLANRDVNFADALITIR